MNSSVPDELLDDPRQLHRLVSLDAVAGVLHHDDDVLGPSTPELGFVVVVDHR